MARNRLRIKVITNLSVNDFDRHVLTQSLDILMVQKDLAPSTYECAMQLKNALNTMNRVVQATHEAYRPMDTY